MSQLEAELSNVSQERNDLGEQLTNTQRKKDVLNDELMRLRHRIEQVSETNSRVNKHLEDLVKECEEKQVSSRPVKFCFPPQNMVLYYRHILLGGPRK